MASSNLRRLRMKMATIVVCFVAATLMAPSSAAIAVSEASVHDRALAAVTEALKAAETNLKLDIQWDLLPKMTTKQLNKLLEMIPTDIKVEVLTDGIKTRATTGCTTGGATVFFIGGVTHTKLWKFKESVYFCWNYGQRTVTNHETPYVEAYVWPTGQAQGWSYQGITNGPVSTPHRDAYGIVYYEDYVQGRFQVCVFNVGCLANAYPWIKLRTYRDGSVSADYSTGV